MAAVVWEPTTTTRGRDGSLEQSAARFGEDPGHDAQDNYGAAN